MAAHTSPVYLEVPGMPRRPPDLSVPLALVDGTVRGWRRWRRIRDQAELARFRRFLDDAERRLRAAQP